MSEWETTEAEAYASGPVQLEFVDAPALNGQDIEWTFRAAGGGRGIPAGTVTSEIAVMTHDHNLIGGGRNTLGSDLGPHDIGGGRIHPAQYTHENGSYSISITIGSDVRYVAYQVHDGQVSPA